MKFRIKNIIVNIGEEIKFVTQDNQEIIAHITSKGDGRKKIHGITSIENFPIATFINWNWKSRELEII